MAGNGESECCGPGYASPAEAMKGPREKLLYTVALYIGTGILKPDYLPILRLSAGSKCRALAMSYTIWGGTPVRPVITTPLRNGAI